MIPENLASLSKTTIAALALAKGSSPGEAGHDLIYFHGRQRLFTGLRGGMEECIPQFFQIDLTTIIAIKGGESVQ